MRPRDEMPGDDDAADDGWKRQLVATLEMQVACDPTGEREALLGILRAQLAGRTVDADPRLLEELDLMTAPDIVGTWEGPPDPETAKAVAAVLDRIARDAPLEGLDRPPCVEPWTFSCPEVPELDQCAPPVEAVLVDPIETWITEARRLRESVGELEKARTALEDLGYRTAGDIADVLTGEQVCPDRDRVRAVVTVMGGDWTGRGYEACYEAALAEQRRRDGHLDLVTPRPGISGLIGADPLTKRSLRGQVKPDLSRLPRLRGRDTLTQDIARRATERDTGTLVLAGPGGSGKSALALAVSNVVALEHYQVWWVAAGDQSQITRGMLAVATCLSAPVVELNAIQFRPEEGAEMLWQRLEACSTPWLLVFDDVGDPAVLDIPGSPGMSWIRPSRAGTVVVTTRSRYTAAWRGRAEVIEVPDLSADAGARALLDRLDEPSPTAERVDTARQLSQRLGGAALAIQIAGAYLRSGLGAEDITGLTAALGPPPGPSGEEITRISGIWGCCVAALSGAGLSHAWDLMTLLASFEPYWVIPLELLAPPRLARCGLLPNPGPEAPGTITEQGWQDALDGLRAVGLVTHRRTAGENVDGVAVHPLVAELARERSRDDRSRVVAAAVALLLGGVTELDAGRPTNRAMLRRLEPHVHALLDNLDADSLAGVRASCLDLANRVARGLVGAGLFAAGEQLVRYAQTRTHPLPDDAAASLDAEHVLALARGLGGDLAEAEQRFIRLVERCETACADTELVLLVREGLAWVLAEQGRLDEALARYATLLPLFNEVHGPDRPATLGVRHRIAWITGLRGRPAEAEKQFEEILPLRTKALGVDHVDVFSSRYRLAWARYAQGKHAQAWDDFTGLLGDLKEVFPDEATQVTMVHAKLGCIRAWNGDFDRAEADFHHVIDTRTQTLGASHARTLRARYDLAWAKARRGDLRQAERLYRDVLAEVERQDGLGTDHPLSLDTRSRLAPVLLELGQLDDAERLARAQVLHRSRVCGPNHPETFRARYTRARVLLERGRYADSGEHLNALLLAQTEHLGEDHRDSLETRSGIAELHARKGHLVEAEGQVREILRCRRRRLGPRSTETLASREQLVWVLGEMGLIDEAESECRALIDARTQAQGATHPDTLSARYRLYWLSSLSGRGDEAAYGFQSLAHEQLQVLGSAHPHTLRTRHGWALELIRARRYDDAGHELREVLATRCGLLGRTHPDTLTNRHALALLLACTGQLAEAERTLRSVLVDQEAALGLDHRHTLCTKERLYWVMDLREDRPRNGRRWHLLLADRERVLGPDHPDTARIRERLRHPDFEAERMWW